MQEVFRVWQNYISYRNITNLKNVPCIDFQNKLIHISEKHIRVECLCVIIMVIYRKNFIIMILIQNFHMWDVLIYLMENPNGKIVWQNNINVQMKVNNYLNYRFPMNLQDMNAVV
jgi:hypothetical protein